MCLESAIACGRGSFGKLLGDLLRACELTRVAQRLREVPEQLEPLGRALVGERNRT